MIHLADLVALVGGIVHTLIPGAEPVVATVLLDGPRIVAVGPAVEVPSSAEVIDVAGLHVIPGLVDGMMNFDAEHDALYTAAGITTVRDVGNDLSVILEAQIPALRERVPGPSLITCGKVLDGSSGVSVDALVLANAGQVPHKLGLLLEEVARHELRLDFLSILETLPREVYGATLAFAKENDLPVWGPLPGRVRLAEALDGGQAGFLGLQALLPAGSHWGNVDPDALEPALAAFAGGESALVPMISVYARMLAERSEEAPELDYLAPTYASQWNQQRAAWQANLNSDARADLEAALELQRGLLVKLWEAGVALVPGSAAPNPWCMPGASLLDELDQWVAAGIAPTEVLRLATAAAAAALGMEAEIGSLAPGLRADLVLLGSDPRISLSALREPEIVVLRGRVLERPRLQAMLAELKTTQDAVRARALEPMDVPAPDAPGGDLILAGRAETWALGLRQSAEHFQVVRLLDGSLAYCSRLRFPATANSVASEMRITQVMQAGLLNSFDVEAIERRNGWDAPEPLDVQTGTPDQVASSERAITVRGRTLGASRIMNVERRVNGQFLDNKPAPDPVALLDASLALNALIVARHFPLGLSYAISLEGSTLAGASDRWNVAVRADDHLIQVRTSRGALAFGMDAKGQPLYAARQRGTDQIELRVSEFDAFGGPGVGLGEERVYVLPQVPPVPEEAAADGQSQDDK